jgi:hypothetical protein
MEQANEKYTQKAKMCIQTCATTEEIKKERIRNNIHIRNNAKKLDRYLAKKKKNTAPGVSGIRIDHIAALPDEYREMIAQLLSIPYLTGTKFEDWNNEIVNWIPKEEGNDDMRKRRPLMYYEVMRKMCMGIKKGEVIKVWHDNGLIDKDNYAFLQGLSTTEPLMIKKWCWKMPNTGENHYVLWILISLKHMTAPSTSPKKSQ